MNTLQSAIADACRERPLAEKWLIAPSLRVGQQWVTAVARAGTSVLNLHCRTVRSMAMHLASPHLLATGRKMMSPRAGEILTDRLWNQHLRRAGLYLGRMEPGIEFCRVLNRAVSDLRLAGLTSGDLPPQAFEADDKATEISQLLRAWETATAAEGRVDYAEVLRFALEALHADGLPDGVLILLPGADSDDYCALEHMLLDALPPKSVVELRRDEACSGDVSSDRSLLAWVSEPTSAPRTVGDGSVDFVKAVGACNEVRQMLRMCADEDLALDEVEVLHTDTDTYLPLLYEAGCELWAGETPSLPDDVPMTFVEGLPVRYTRPGRALAAWLQWWREGYTQGVLVRMLQDGLLNRPPGADGAISWQELADLMRPLPIGNGRERYGPRLAAAVSAARSRQQEPQRRDENGEPLQDAQEADRQLRALTLLQDIVAALLAATPRDASDGPEVLRCALEFLALHAHCADEFDEFGRKKLREEIEELADLLSPGADVSMDVARWLATLPQDVRVRGLGPRPGCLHVANVRTGGHSGRPVTFIIGLDDGRFPGGGTQDPVLLDRERARIDERLPLASTRIDAQVRRFAATLAGLRGRVVLCYPCRDLSDDRELFPSPVMIDAYRIVSGEPDADQGALLEHMGPARSFAPERETECLNSAEWWLWRLCATDAVDDARTGVLRDHGHLARGEAARTARTSDRFTRFDGYVPEAGEALDPRSDCGIVLSASSLETLGRCPLQFFFGRVLGLSVPDELELDPDRWLDALATGLLLHNVFHDFMVDLARRDALPPRFDRDLGRLMDLLEEQIERSRRKLPPPHPSVFERERHALEAACRNFLAAEEEFCRKSTPRYFEASVGMRSSDPPTDLDLPDPPALNLPGGASVRARGRLDRVDEIAPGQWSIWDYKTGGATAYSKLKDGDPFDGGRRVQHALYIALAEHALKRLDSRARVHEFGYFMPSERGDAERVSFTPEELAGGRLVIERLVRTLAAGAFLPTDDSEHTCEYCDFLPICGDVQALTAAARRKLDESGEEVLTPFRELRDHE